jgi:hypothetical protein
MVSLGFENYAETLKIHLAKLRQVRRTPRDYLFLIAALTRFFLSIRLQPLRVEKLGRAPKCTRMMSERRWMTPSRALNIPYPAELYLRTVYAM